MNFARRWMAALSAWIHRVDLARDLAFFFGVGSFVYGVGMVYRPAGFIVLGLLLMSHAFVTAAKPK
jgi:hypothetical protein